MIILNKNEKRWILMCKGQLQAEFAFTGNWVNALKPLFEEIYGWSPDEDNNYQDYLRGMFNKLLDITLKIKDNWSDENGQLKEVFEATFYKNNDLPIERAICSLVSIIQRTSVIDSNGNKRFEL